MSFSGIFEYIFPSLALSRCQSWSVLARIAVVCLLGTATVPIVAESISNFQLTGVTATLDPLVEAACKDYLKSKGLDTRCQRIAIKAFNNHSWSISDHTYAFTVRARRTIYLSLRMVSSIKHALDHHQPLHIYDRFTLLHEVGHIFPYGFEHDRFSTELLCWFLLSMGACMAIPILDVTISSITGSKMSALYAVIMASICTTLFLKAGKLASIEKGFKKASFEHVDQEFAEYMKAGYEEQDADLFAYKLFSREELQELYALLSSCKRKGIKIDENGYHPTEDEARCTIAAELTKRSA